MLISESQISILGWNFEAVEPAMSLLRHPSTKAFAELDVVKAIAPIEGHRVKVLPGATGTIVFVHEAGAAYEVEFDEPIHVILCAKQEDLELA